MRTIRLMSGLALLCAVGAVTFQTASAGQEEYKPKAKVTPLVEKPLEGVDGRTVLIRHFELPPNFEGGRHIHPGPVFVYVLDGELTVDVDGMERQSFKAGEVYEEPIGRVMQGRNLSSTNPAKIVVFQVGEAGKPMMIKAQ